MTEKPQERDVRDKNGYYLPEIALGDNPKSLEPKASNGYSKISDHWVRVADSAERELKEKRSQQWVNGGYGVDGARLVFAQAMIEYCKNPDVFVMGDGVELNKETFAKKPGESDEEYDQRRQEFMNSALALYTRRKHYYKYTPFLRNPNGFNGMPLNFASNADASAHLEKLVEELQKEKQQASSADSDPGKKPKGESSISIGEAVRIFHRARLAATLYDGTVMFYDYDAKVYTYDERVPSRWVSSILGQVSQSNLKTFLMTIQAFPDKLLTWNPLPRYKIAVGNGIYNTLSKKLEPYTPYEMVLNRIETNYNSQAKEPLICGGAMTFEKMISDLADNNPDRIQLIQQMVKAIFLGHSPSKAMFILRGNGGDGKSVFMDLISRVIGDSNVGSMTFADFDSEDKRLAVATKRLILGADNNKNARVRNMDFFKRAVTGDPISISRKYLSEVTVRFTGVMVQICNTFPRFAETGSSTARRIVVIECLNSHYERNNELSDLASSVSSKAWHEYILKTVLDMDNGQFGYWSDFNDVDRDVLVKSLSDSDSIGSFFSYMEDQGAFREGVNTVPENVLYALYEDFMDGRRSGDSKKYATTFHTEAVAVMKEYGYEISDSKVSLNAVEPVSGVDYQDAWFSLLTGKHAEAVLGEDGSMSGTFVFRRGDRFKSHRESRNGARRPRPLSVAEYFDLYESVAEDFMLNPQGYADIFIKNGFSYSEHSSSGTSLKDHMIGHNAPSIDDVMATLDEDFARARDFEDQNNRARQAVKPERVEDIDDLNVGMVSDWSEFMGDLVESGDASLKALVVSHASAPLAVRDAQATVAWLGLARDAYQAGALPIDRYTSIVESVFEATVTSLDGEKSNMHRMSFKAEGTISGRHDYLVGNVIEDVIDGGVA